MKKTFLLIAFVALQCAPSFAKDWPGFSCGMGMGGWLTNYKRFNVLPEHRRLPITIGDLEHFDSYITEADVAAVKSFGFDHIRLGFDQIVLEETPFKYRERTFGKLDEFVGWCAKHKLGVVLNLHKAVGNYCDIKERVTLFESDELQRRFIALWLEIERRYHDRSELAFELLNEVTDESYSRTWNEICRVCIGKIRAIAPDVVILVGSYWNNHVSAVKALDKPYDDKIVYNFHCYEPPMFTHQGAPWVKQMDTSFRQPFTESGTTAAYFEEMFAEAVAYAEAQGTVLYCGEYGVIDRATPEDTLEWYKVINSVFTKHNIGRAAWTWRGMDFELCGPRMASVLPELVKYM